uniref:Wall-associated receptor kinase 5-like n=1 Tax=Nelumbo nucifera TaxID=4432 RepID=A0A822YGC2_NELNU|nr:TPA_asm: hypothetical protein HUJ06_031747 [Nelumbo nucifera]
MLNGTYPAMGYCQTNNTKGLKSFYGILKGEYQFYKNFSPCAYSFVADYKWYNFSIDHLSDFGFYTRNKGMVPTILDWAIENDSCKNITMRNNVTYACGENSGCHDSHNGLGYLCECLEGYQGNPYLQDGCQDINECSDPTMNDCLPSLICKNTAGSYNCSCPSGTEGDGRRNGTGCIPIPPPPPSQTKLRVIQVSIGIAIGILFVLSVSSLLYWRIKNRRMNIRKEKCFQQNGGLLLRQQLSSYDVSVDIAKIFTEEELKRATNNYDENLILGRGGYDTVYKGIFPNNKIVAIKKSKIIDESQVEQFINEVVILSQINHINVVKFLGCCLESEVPLLVYEFITSGTLFHHIHDEGHRSSLSWDNRLRIAAETASALAYMHFAASPPIFHRDIKSTNILLDDNYTAKVSDFGASRLVPLDQTQFTTLVQGTMGYLDPEYFHTSRLTEKSDVYSFGIVLAELLTGRKALEFDRPEKEKSLALHFISSMKEENILDILEDRVLYEANEDQLREVAKLVERCLSVKGEERPTMKEVAMELEGLRRSRKHLWDEPHEEVECLLGDPPNSQNFNTTNYDSLGNQVVISLDCGR